MFSRSIVYVWMGAFDMNLLQIFILSLVQGLTEFLPISSSGHLVLAPHLFGWADQGMAFDVAVHLGTLIAVVWYFKKDVREMFYAGIGIVTGQNPTTATHFFKALVIATIPAGIAGLMFSGLIERDFRAPIVIATTTIVFGIVLWLSDVYKKEHRDEHDINYKDALLIGLAQVLALIPGTSRSGITMTAGLALGLGREAAARFSFLLAIPVITLASLLQIFKLVRSSQAVDWLALFLGVVVSAVSAYLCIRVFLSWIEKVGFLPFAIYRVVLGIAIIAVLV